MEKRVAKAFGKKNYLIGKDNNGICYWLEEASWDCDWYWGFGYVRTYTNNEYPEKSRDINCHCHFDKLFFKGNMMSKDMFDIFFVECVLDEKEKWKLLELMKTFYTMKDYSELICRGGSHYTDNPVKEDIKNEDEYRRINEIVLPKIFEEIYKLLGGEK